LLDTQDEIFYSSTHKKRLLINSIQPTQPGFSTQEKEAVFHGGLEKILGWEMAMKRSLA
jgi:hypothetical protein